MFHCWQRQRFHSLTRLRVHFARPIKPGIPDAIMRLIDEKPPIVTRHKHVRLA